jgi:hypothetical protein
MIITTENGTIKSDTEGMLLTDGETYGVEYLLGEDRSVKEFYEISIDEYNALMTEEGGEDHV